MLLSLFHCCTFGVWMWFSHEMKPALRVPWVLCAEMKRSIYFCHFVFVVSICHQWQFCHQDRLPLQGMQQVQWYLSNSMMTVIPLPAGLSERDSSLSSLCVSLFTPGFFCTFVNNHFALKTKKFSDVQQATDPRMSGSIPNVSVRQSWLPANTRTPDPVQDVRSH